MWYKELTCFLKFSFVLKVSPYVHFVNTVIYLWFWIDQLNLPLSFAVILKNYHCRLLGFVFNCKYIQNRYITHTQCGFRTSISISAYKVRHQRRCLGLLHLLVFMYHWQRSRIFIDFFSTFDVANVFRYIIFHLCADMLLALFVIFIFH